jgi:hypothetical protein
VLKVNLVDLQDPMALPRTGFLNPRNILAILPMRLQAQAPNGKTTAMIGMEVTVIFLEHGIQVHVKENPQTVHEEYRKCLSLPSQAVFATEA